MHEWGQGLMQKRSPVLRYSYLLHSPKIVHKVNDPQQIQRMQTSVGPQGNAQTKTVCRRNFSSQPHTGLHYCVVQA